MSAWLLGGQVPDAREQRSGVGAASCDAGPGDPADHCRPGDAADTATDAERSTGTARVRLTSSLNPFAPRSVNFNCQLTNTLLS